VSRARTLASLKRPNSTCPPAHIILTWLPKFLKVTEYHKMLLDFNCCFICNSELVLYPPCLIQQRRFDFSVSSIKRIFVLSGSGLPAVSDCPCEPGAQPC
jgi:hypothetical protein